MYKHTNLIAGIAPTLALSVFNDVTAPAFAWLPGCLSQLDVARFAKKYPAVMTALLRSILEVTVKYYKALLGYVHTCYAVCDAVAYTVRLVTAVIFFLYTLLMHTETRNL